MIMDRLKNVKKWVWFTLAAAIALQIYFVQELLAAELLFGLLLAIGLFIAFIIFVVREIGERGFGWVKPRARELAGSAWRRVVQIEEFSRKTFRHQRSESAP
jgi:uncharacterized PurR-regulated membrane protein YhhQ (DUF165 family)